MAKPGRESLIYGWYYFSIAITAFIITLEAFAFLAVP